MPKFFRFNLTKWSQKRGLKKFKRNGIFERVLDKNGNHIHYFEGGSGETVVLIHGFGGDAQVTWGKTILDLKKDFHVIALDLLWFGQSHSSSQPNLLSQIATLKLLLDEIGITEATLVGVSYGGFVSMAFSYHYPESVKKLVMVDSPGFTYNSALLNDICQAYKVQSIDEIFVPKNPAEVQRLFNLAFYKSRRIPKMILREIYNLYFAQHHKELTQLMTSLLTEQDTYLVNEFKNKPKSIVIWGEEDNVFPLAEGRVLSEYLNSSFVAMPQSGHAMNIESFQSFQKVLRTFLAE
ncbi:MAG: alpha/beta fold hydrolase [Crocinitomix sp.]|nr:alpha/beta fold hydrolase [Crocinitomix sp.]